MSSNSSLLGVENTNASSPINQIFGSEPPSKYLTSTGSSSTSATRTPNPEYKVLKRALGMMVTLERTKMLDAKPISTSMDQNLASTIRDQQRRALELWERYWIN
uniref:Uncharacterized protein n=1 Tax=Cucumis melo TaxID=3656 RepID=A0A9I9E1J9_CUCME